MIAIRKHTPERETFGTRMILLNDGREIHLDDITSADEGLAILDEVENAIASIEAQLENAAKGLRPNDPSWRIRADTALRQKRRQRPRLQQRISSLRRAEREATTPRSSASPRKEGKRHAFVQAAEAMLDHELFVEVWDRAREMYPAAFGEAAQS